MNENHGKPETVQWVKALATKHDSLSSSPGTVLWKGEPTPLSFPLTFTHINIIHNFFYKEKRKKGTHELLQIKVSRPGPVS